MVGLMTKAESFEVPKLTKEEVLAIKAVYDGVADAYTQRLMMSVVINKFSRAHDILFIPGKPDESVFLNGRAFVGMQLLKYINIKVGGLKDEDTPTA